MAGFHSVDTISAHLNMLLVRCLPDGDLDPAFGIAGIVITDAGGTETGRELVQQPDGTLVVAGSFGRATKVLFCWRAIRRWAVRLPILTPAWPRWRPS